MKSLQNLDRYEIMLASASPRRKELLGMLGISFSVLPVRRIDETYPAGMSAKEIPQYLSQLKASAYANDIERDQMIITADTLVINNGIVLGKPRNRHDAEAMLRDLSGHTHDVVTGVTVTTTSAKTSFCSCTKVEFAQLTDREIADYVENFNPIDKAGGYGIQEWIGCIGIKRIDGCFYNVMGLPLHELYSALKNF